jgi:hypothetical protein
LWGWGPIICYHVHGRKNWFSSSAEKEKWFIQNLSIPGQDIRTIPVFFHGSWYPSKRMQRTLQCREMHPELTAIIYSSTESREVAISIHGIISRRVPQPHLHWDGNADHFWATFICSNHISRPRNAFAPGVSVVSQIRRPTTSTPAFHERCGLVFGWSWWNFIKNCLAHKTTTNPWLLQSIKLHRKSIQPWCRRSIRHSLCTERLHES